VLVLAWYLATALLLIRARGEAVAWLLAPAVAAFPLSNLLDWPWHLTGTGVLWAIAVGGLLGARLDPRGLPHSPLDARKLPSARSTRPDAGAGGP
jgi:hypothetical protein